MKNSRISQIAVIIGLAITIILSYVLASGTRWGRGFNYPLKQYDILSYIVFIIAIGVIIYYIAMSKKKIFLL